MKTIKFKFLAAGIISATVMLFAYSTSAQTLSGKLYFSAMAEDKISLYGNRLNGPDMYGLGVGQSTFYNKSALNYSFLINKNVASTATAADIYNNSTFWFTSNVMRFLGPEPRFTIQDNSVTTPTYSARLYLLKSGTAVNGGFLLYHATSDYLSLGIVQNGTQYPGINIKQSNQFVGIGTTAPASKLDLVGTGGGTIDLKVNGRIQTGDAGNAGGMWCNSALTQFFGQIEPSIVPNTVGIYNSGWRLAVSNSGKIGIGTATPQYKLHVESSVSEVGTAYFKSNYTGNAHHAAIVADGSDYVENGYGTGIEAHGGLFGVLADGDAAYNAGGTVFAINANAFGGKTNSGTKYGIYSTASNGAVNYAGYFAGDVYSTGYYLPSDKRLKNDIQPIKGSLDKLMLLRPSTYNYKIGEFSNMRLPSNPQNGLIADEVEKVFPELVKEQVQPAEYGKDNKEVIKPEEHFKGVNYIGLIPVMISSIQEQQAKINSQETKIEKLEKEVVALQKDIISSAHENTNNIDLNGAYLQQNAPNPFSENTSISYFVPEAANSAVIKIYSFNGEELRSYPVTEKGKGTLVVNAGSLSQGTYTYQLIVNSQTVDTKLMVITK